jgi:hypothetical protein
MRVCQKLASGDLIIDLLRAGYVKTQGINVWSGS